MAEDARERTRIIKSPFLRTLAPFVIAVVVGVAIAAFNIDLDALTPDVGFPGWLSITLKLSFLGLAGIATAVAFDRKSSTQEEGESE